MNELAQEIREILFYGKTEFDKFSEEQQAELAGLYICEMGMCAYEVFEDIDPKDFEPHMKDIAGGVNYPEIGKIIVRSMIGYIKEDIQKRIDIEVKKEE